MTNFKAIYYHKFLLGTLVFLLAACQEDRDLETATLVPIADQPDIMVENGLLHFKDQSVWVATIQEMQKAEDYGDYVATLGFENSLLAKYGAIKQTNEPLDDYLQEGKLPRIEDNLFASLLNDEAMVKIGSTLYKVSEKYTFSVVDEDGSMRKKFQETKTPIDKLPGVNTFENIDNLAGKTLVIENEVDGKKITARFLGEKEYQVPNPDASDHRVLVGAWSRTYAVYSSVGIKLKAERYHKGGILGKYAWRDYNANYLFCFGEALTKECGTYNCENEEIETGGKIKYNSHRVQKTLANTTVPGPWHVTTYIDATYRYRYASGQRVHETKFRFE